jgi:hypothetical protein
VAPVIIATDKMQLTQFSGSKSAYPVYLTLGNIPRAIHCKPSQQACVLIGYLSVEKILGSKPTKKDKFSCIQHLFHDSMRTILGPLKGVGRTGMEVMGRLEWCIRFWHAMWPIIRSSAWSLALSTVHTLNISILQMNWYQDSRGETHPTVHHESYQQC